MLSWEKYRRETLLGKPTEFMCLYLKGLKDKAKNNTTGKCSSRTTSLTWFRCPNKWLISTVENPLFSSPYQAQTITCKRTHDKA